MTTKPFELDPKAAMATLREARRRHRIIHLNCPAPLLSPDLEQIERWREEFQLGKPVGARADAWTNYREKADGSWYDDPKLCPVAPIFRIGIYLITISSTFLVNPTPFKCCTRVFIPAAPLRTTRSWNSIQERRPGQCLQLLLRGRSPGIPK